MHRAEQIIEAMAAAIRASANVRGETFTNRALSLSEEAGELPARSVDFGEDDPPDDDGATSFNLIDSILTVDVTHYVRGTSEADVRSALMTDRAAVHVALMANSQQLGLDFVIGVRYGGASEPEFDAESEYIAGSLFSRWAVHYRMNLLDPN